MAMLDRNPLAHKSPAPKSSLSPQPNGSPVTLQSDMLRSTTPNFQYLGGRRNHQYHSPTFQSTIFSSPTNVRREETHNMLNTPQRNMNTTPLKIERPATAQATQEMYVDMTPITKTQTKSPVMRAVEASDLKAFTPSKVEHPSTPPTKTRLLQQNLYSDEKVQPTSQRPQTAIHQTPTRSARPADNHIFLGPNFSPKREEDERRTSEQIKRATAQNATPAKDVICMACANEENLLTRQQEADRQRAREQELEREKIRQMEAAALERQKAELRARALLQQAYEQDKMMSEKKRREALDARKGDYPELDKRQKAREAYNVTLEQARLHVVQNIQEYRRDLDVQNVSQSEKKKNEFLSEREKEMNHKGLPIGNYHWEYRDLLANELNKQIEHKKLTQAQERQEELARAQKLANDAARMKDLERQYRQEAERLRREQVTSIMDELKQLKDRRQREKAQVEDLKRLERETLEEANRRSREIELQRKFASMMELSKGLQEGVSAKKMQETARKQEELLRRSQQTPVKTVACCTHMNCAKCKRRIPMSGAFQA